MVEEVNIFEADDPTNNKLEYIIFNGEKIDIIDISKLFSYILKYYNKDLIPFLLKRCKD